LTGFEIWLEYAARHKDDIEQLESPEQLPVVLQVLLSQVHRIRALKLLRRFLELGHWAVNLSLSLGIFPYVMKLLQSPEYKTLLVNIWASILKFDPSCQVDLVKDGALPHFIQPLASWGNNTNGSTNNVNGSTNTNLVEAAKQRTLSAFALAATCHKYPQGQTGCMRQNLHGHCCALLTTYAKLEQQYHQQQQQQQQQQPNRVPPEPMHTHLLSATSRMWLCLCLGNLVQKCPPAQREAFHTNMHICLLSRLQDSDSHVRAATAYALGCLLEYAPDLPPPPSPPAMSLGPQGLAPQGTMPPPTFQPGQQILVPQHHMSATTMNVPSGLTASAVLSGRLEPTMGQQQPNMGPLPTNPMWPGQPQGPPMQPQPGQPELQLQPPHMQQQQQMQPQQLQPQMQPPQLQPQMQPHHPQMQQMQMQPPQMQPRPQHQQQPLAPGPSQPGQQPTMDRLSANARGLRLEGQHIPPGAPLLHQQNNMLRPQGGGSSMPPMMGGPNGMMPRHMAGNSAAALIGSPLGGPPMASMSAPQGFFMNPIPPPEQPRRRPTIYEDRRRLELDLGVVERIIKVILADGSSVVRYEAVMALCNFVEKYMQAFLVVVEESSSWLYEEDDVPGLSMDNDEEDDESRRNSVVPIPRGVNRAVLDRFAACWRSLRLAQHKDAHPKVMEAASLLASAVHEQLLDVRMKKEMERAKRETEVGLSGIAEEGGEFERTQSEQNLLQSPDGADRPAKTHPRSDGPLHRQPGAKYPLRRTASEHGGMQPSDPQDKPRSSFLSPQTAPIPPAATEESKPHNKEYSLPRSNFYTWKKAAFKSNYDDSDDDDPEDRDPLNPVGAALAYQHRRNALVHATGRRLTDHFVGLKPKAPKKKRQYDILLDSDEEADEKNSSLKRELKLRESKLLRNTGVKMVSMLKFHSYEDILMVCDSQDGISIWDYEKGSRNLSYKNGNPKGSRMTSALWINESSTSLFFVGCDDGSARIWNGVVESNGAMSTASPTLASAFFAVPDMEAGQRGSGLICEWQQFSGSLIAGGNSKYIRCWDLASEKCASTLETDTEACVTTLTTAWDDGIDAMHGGYIGMGPDIVVAGHSDGSLKLFDIRSPNAAAQVGGRTRRHTRFTKFTEHRSWIVDTSFTSYGGQFEIISGSVAGDVRAWDLRMSNSLRTLDVQRSPMTALSVHKQIPVAATGSHAQFIKILTLDGETLQVVRFHENKSGHRIGPVSCLEFHKKKLVLAAGATNSFVSIYKPKHPSSI
jgi:hypothetical protein